MYKKCIKKNINILDKWKAIWYIYIILIDGMHKNLFGEGGPCGSAERF